MAERTCYNCVYCCCDPCLWLNLMRLGEEILPRCANHPFWPGQLREVPGVPCRNYRPRPTTPEGDGVRMIPLTEGGYAYVDAADYEWLSQWKWHLEKGYAARFENRKTIFMHRQIMQPPDDMVVDHLDANKVNNCRLNLRVCTCAENNRNRVKRSHACSPYKGVTYNRTSHKWVAKCYYHGEPIWLGSFDDEIEAARAYDRKAVELFGEFARLNFPREWPPQRRAEVYAQRQEPSDEDRRRKAKGKRKKGKGKDATAHAQTRGRRDQKHTTKSAQATAAKPQGTKEKGKRKKGEAEGRRAPPQ